jgi:hypothetical protein
MKDALQDVSQDALQDVSQGAISCNSSFFKESFEESCTASFRWNQGLSTTVKISICTITIVVCSFATVLETRALLHPTK